MSGTLTPVERRNRRNRARRRTVRRRVTLAVAVVIAVGVPAAAVVLTGRNGTSTSPPRQTTTSPSSTTTARPPPGKPQRTRTVLVDRDAASLPAPVQDASGATVRGRTVLLGGLTASDISTDQIISATPADARLIGRLPSVRHDTAAAALGGHAYVFGGGNGTAQLDEIVRIDPATGSSAVVGRLPAASSDSAGATIGATAYVVGGYTGTSWLDTVVAWRPGSQARVVAHLPTPVRYAAVAAASGKLIVAGGSLPDGTASAAVYEWAPGAKAVKRIGSLPAPTTHAAAAAIGTRVYVLGGRGATVDTPTARVVAVDVLTHHITSAGSLTHATSDGTATALGKRILLAGGRTSAGTVASLVVLREAQVAVHRSTKAATRSVAVYAHDGANMLTGAARLARPLVYVPNSQSNTVDVIDPQTYRIVEHFQVGLLPQHVVPAWDLRTLYVTNDVGNSLTVIDPRTGKPGRTIPVDDPYNMYFTPNGKHAIVVAERLHRLDFRNPHTFTLQHSLAVPCLGVDHMDFSADGRYLLASCEFSGQLVKIDVASERVVGTLTLPEHGSMPQDVKLSPDGTIFYVADQTAGGIWEVDGDQMKVRGFLRTGAGAHGLYPSRDGRLLYVTNRRAGTISVVSFATRKIVTTWTIPGGGSPDMGGVTANGKVLWVSGRYSAAVYAISTRDGRLLAKIPVGLGPHGVCVWPQPGRYSLGHTGELR